MGGRGEGFFLELHLMGNAGGELLWVVLQEVELIWFSIWIRRGRRGCRMMSGRRMFGLLG